MIILFFYFYIFPTLCQVNSQLRSRLTDIVLESSLHGRHLDSTTCASRPAWSHSAASLIIITGVAIDCHHTQLLSLLVVTATASATGSATLRRASTNEHPGRQCSPQGTTATSYRACESAPEPRHASPSHTYCKHAHATLCTTVVYAGVTLFVADNHVASPHHLNWDSSNSPRLATFDNDSQDDRMFGTLQGNHRNEREGYFGRPLRIHLPVPCMLCSSSSTHVASKACARSVGQDSHPVSPNYHRVLQIDFNIRPSIHPATLPRCRALPFPHLPTCLGLTSPLAFPGGGGSLCLGLA